jgi:pimeloyl-ACP methyl ester carboxylesterase
VLLHGAIADARVWRRQIEDLSDEFTVVAWDAPGAGRSSDPPEAWGMPDWADALAELLEALDLGPAHVLGISWGGTLALELYRRHAERTTSLILADAYAGWKGSLPPDECERRLEMALRTTALPPAEMVPHWLPDLVSRGAPPERVDELVAIMSDVHPAGAALMAHSMANSDLRDVLPAIQVPTLVLWGEEDVRSPTSIAEELVAAIPAARLAVIPGAGHESNIEQPELFTAAVRDFCRSAALA